MQQFKISEATYKKLVTRLLAMMIPMGAITLLIFILIDMRRPPDSGPDKMPLFLTCFLLFTGVSIIRAYRKQRQQLKSFTVTISDSGITREQMNTRTISIQPNDIREIIKTRKGSFTIKGADPLDVIQIPHWIEDAAGLEKGLQAFGPITGKA